MNITVTGSHKVSMPPERATLHITVAAETDHPESALQMVTSHVNDLHNELNQLRNAHPTPITWFAVLPIRTRSWRPWNKDGDILPVRFGASCDIKVKFSDFPAMSRYIAGIGVGALTKVNFVEWALTEATRNQVEEQVLAGAVADAHKRARQIAAAAGKTGVEPVEIADPGLLSGLAASVTTDSGHVGSARMLGAARGDAGAPEAIDLAPEDINLVATVHARFTCL